MNDDSKIQLPSRRNSPELNKKMLERAAWGSKEMKKFRETIQARFRFDMKDEKKFPAHDPSFSINQFIEKAMRETNSASGYAQLLRAGIQTVVNRMYSTVETTFEQWTHTTQSTRDTELYAPLHGMTFPGEVGPGEKYIESTALGLDLKLKNRKYGEMFPVEKELIEDDQTGQFHGLVGDMAEYAKQVLEVIVYGKLASVSNMQYSNLRVPVTETKPSDEANYPYASSAAPLIGGGLTRPVAFGAMNQTNIQNGIIAQKNQLNLLGLKMNVMTDTILHSPFYAFDIGVLLNSSYYPSGAAATGSTGGAFAINPIKGIVAPIESRFMFDQNGSVSNNSKAWYLLDKKKPWFIVQIREAASVTQENPDSGESFDRDVYRWKLSLRANADFIDPRFVWQGSDGSV